MIEVDARTTALIVVDMQNDFCSPEGYYAKQGANVQDFDAVIAPVGRLVARSRQHGATIVFTRLLYPPGRAMEDRHALRPRRWTSTGARLVPGTWGAEVVDALRPQPTDIVVDKAGYSAFEGTDLDHILRVRGIRTVLMTGVVSYACVLATAFSAFDKDFDVLMVADAVASWGGRLQREAGDVVDLLLGQTVPAADIAFI
jgi:ureidoacrylate peracid hydrolase